MKSNGLANTIAGKVEKTTLKDYYASLPSASYPKTDLINEISKECGVSSNTVRNWIFLGMTPANDEHRDVVNKIISEREGKEIDVWSD